MIIVTRESLETLKLTHQVFKVKKTAVTKARLFTEDDLNRGFVSPQRAEEIPVPNHIWTREGLVSFDIEKQILCEGVDGELWPMWITEFNKIKEKISESDKDGWASYINSNISEAIHMEEPFQTQRPSGEWSIGEPGDWLLFNEVSIWPVGADIFASSYIIL